jgi:hypothetical protein
MDETRTPTTADIAGASSRTEDVPVEDEQVGAERGDVDDLQAEREVADTTSSADEPAREQLLPDEQEERLTARWREIQAGFVDEPRQSVEQADALVADLMQRLAASFSQEREHLVGQWDSGDDVSTEDLRVALTRYRSFFERLLSA